MSTPVIPPFRIAVIGDSVMWGQGLDPAEKFPSILADFIGTTTGRPVELQVAAHSGAIIRGGTPMDDSKFAAMGLSGEVPTPFPTILTQATGIKDAGGHVTMPFFTSPETIDLVLMNGGINDLSAENIILASTGAESDFDQLIKGSIYESMKVLAAQARIAFPNALLLVPGYFPLISTLSEPKAITDSIFSFTIPGHYAQVEFKTLEHFSNVWKQQSDFWLQRALIDADYVALKPAALSYGPLSGTMFVSIPWMPENCYAASNRFLWELNENDPARAGRIPACKLAWSDPATLHSSLTPTSGIQIGAATCQTASAFHPNVAGALNYAATIISALQSRLQSVWKYTPPTPAFTATLTPFGATLELTTAFTVEAYDRDNPTQKLTGTVSINGVKVGTTFAAFNYTPHKKTVSLGVIKDYAPHTSGQNSMGVQRAIYTDYPQLTVTVPGYPDPGQLLMGPTYSTTQFIPGILVPNFEFTLNRLGWAQAVMQNPAINASQPVNLSHLANVSQNFAQQVNVTHSVSLNATPALSGSVAPTAAPKLNGM